MKKPRGKVVRKHSLHLSNAEVLALIDAVNAGIGEEIECDYGLGGASSQTRLDRFTSLLLRLKNMSRTLTKKGTTK